jgi:hypothetical protein
MNIGNYLEIGLAIWALIVVPRGIWRAWHRPASKDDSQMVDLAARHQPSGWSVRGELARLFLVSDAPANMSSRTPDQPLENASDRRELHRVPWSVSVSATPNTDDTEPVSGVAGASAIDTNARDIIRASVIAELLDSGLLTNRDKAICQAFRCSKASSARPDAPFQVALRLVEQHRAKARPELIGEMIERVQREVAGESR